MLLTLSVSGGWCYVLERCGIIARKRNPHRVFISVPNNIIQFWLPIANRIPGILLEGTPAVPPEGVFRAAKYPHCSTRVYCRFSHDCILGK